MTVKAPIAVVIVAFLLLVLSAHRLPAPINELPDSPSPAAIAATPAASKPKPIKPVKQKSPMTTPSRSVSSDSPSAASSKRFAGTWTGILSWSFFGDTEFSLVVDPSEKWVTRVTKKWPDRPVARAEIHGNSLTARFPVMHGTFQLTLAGDGQTAVVHGTAPTADSTAVFRHQ
jgi:hypothetical protein